MYYACGHTSHALTLCSVCPYVQVIERGLVFISNFANLLEEHKASLRPYFKEVLLGGRHRAARQSVHSNCCLWPLHPSVGS